MRDRLNPQFEDAVIADPHLELSDHERRMYMRDINRPTRRLLLPIFRFVVVVSIHIIRFVKRYLPFRVASHRLLSKLSPWFLGTMLSPEALEYIIKHFQYETALINFVADNCGSDEVKRVDQLPTHASELGDVDGVNAIVLHDINIYNHIIDTGADPHINVHHRVADEAIDFSALTLPEIDAEYGKKRLLQLDIETSAYIMLLFLVLFLSDEEGERAALSLQFDESLMSSLSNLTGDNYFMKLCPVKYTHWLRYHFDVVLDLRLHMMSVDMAYNRLLALKNKIKSDGNTGTVTE